MKTSLLATAAALMSLTLAPARAADNPTPVPFGHPDFYPSPERPVGWRGDGNGAFPGAKVVSDWNADTGHNVAWRANPPGAGFSQPIVVGEKVFVTCDPNILACFSVHTGELLWQTALDHTALMPPEMQKAARAEMAFFAGKWREYHAWCEAWDDLADALLAAKLDPNSIATSPHQNRQLRKPDATLTVESLRKQWETLYAQQEENSWGRNLAGYGHRDLITKGALWQRWQEANRQYDFWWFDVWEGATTASFATPVSDGSRVYVTLQNNNVAAVNFDGSIAWHVWDHLGDAEGKRNTLGARGVRYVASPVLYRNFLFVYQDHHARCYDTRDGKKLWEHIGPYGRWQHVGHQGTFSEMYKDGVPPFVAVERTRGEGTSPILVLIPVAGGGVQPAVHDGINILYRLEDGKVLTKELPFGTASSPNTAGNVLMRASKETFMVRLTAKDRDSVEMEFLYRTPKNGQPWVAGGYFGDHSKIAHEGWWYASFGMDKGPQGPGGYRQSTTDGRIERFGPSLRLSGYCSPILVGDEIYYFGEGFLLGRPAAGKVRPSPEGGASVQRLDLKAGTVSEIPRAVRDTRLFEDSDYALANRHTTDPNFLSNSSPLAQANRIFFRSKGVLFCFGDTSQPFPAPSNCPPAAKVPASTWRWCLGPEVIPQSTDDPQVIAAIRAAQDAKDLVQHLQSKQPTYRREALKRLVSGKLSAPSSTLESLASNDPYEQIRAEALRLLGVDVGQAGAALLRKMLLESQGVHGSYVIAARELQTLHQLGGSVVEPILVALASEADGKIKTRAAEIASLLPLYGPALRDVLLAMVPDRNGNHAKAALEALSAWPADPAVTALFTKIVSNEKDWGFHQAAMRYLLRALPEDQKNAMLAQAAKAWSGQGNATTLLERGALKEITTLVNETKDRIQAGIISALVQTATASKKPEHLKFAAEMGMLALKKPSSDLHALNGIIHHLRTLGADGAPLLPLLKAMKIDDAGVAKTVTETIAEIEAKVAEAGKM